YHPIYLDLTSRPVLIVGGGNVALEKLETLLPSGADITVVSPTAAPDVQDLSAKGALRWEQREFRDEDIEKAFMVIAATDDPGLNARVFKLGEAARKLTNSVDDPVNCNFIMAAIAQEGPLQVAVSSAGCSPALAQRVRKRIKQEILTPELGALAEFLGSWRDRVKAALPTYQARKSFWESVIESPIPGILEREGVEAADAAMANLFADHRPHRVGHVTLVGAGPGDPDLITVKGLKALQSAEVVLYDRLANPALLSHAPSNAPLIDVGKAPGECGRPRQETIHALLIEHARRGRRVVRLKGGDPFVFGRGGEEVLALAEAGISYSVVPGVSSAISAPAAAGIPVTHRGLSTGFAVFTAQGASEAETVPWEIAAGMPTVIFLMGVERLPNVVRRLREHGRPADTPVAVISRATLPEQRQAIGTLESIESLAAELQSPATIVVGEVVRLGSPELTRVLEGVGA
ncbi:MAG TPA: siroheme synthase CysG, partial [Fimbriimonadaceae bacterium]|nr:siroheme synthase CysG [Fimbriimonadaceae bacterium]